MCIGLHRLRWGHLFETVFVFISTWLLKMLHVGYRCHSVRAAVSRRSSLGVSKAEPSGSIQAALSTSRGKATAAEKKKPLSLPLSLSYSHPNNVPLPFHVLFISPQLQEILLLFNCFQRLNPLHTKSGCHYIKYYLMPGLKQKNYWSMCCSWHMTAEIPLQPIETYC